MKFNDKEYEYYSWSIIDLPKEYINYYKDVAEQIIENSKFYSNKFGYKYNEVYKELELFLNKQGFFISIHYPEYLFISSQFIKGTFVLKLVNE